MRRIALLASLVIAATFMAGTSPAEAQHYGTKCRTHNPASFRITVCTAVNVNDNVLAEQSEGFSHWQDYYSYGYTFRIEYDYIRYYRLDGGTAVKVEAKEGDATFNPFTDDNHSTDWYSHCDRPDGHFMYTAIRYHAWVVIPFEPDQGTGWQQMTSYQQRVQLCGG